jgi:hypothetical protein
MLLAAAADAAGTPGCKPRGCSPLGCSFPACCRPCPPTGAHLRRPGVGARSTRLAYRQGAPFALLAAGCRLLAAGQLGWPGCRSPSRRTGGERAAAPQVVVVANPANTNALILKQHAPHIPDANITCLTRLDHNRALGQVRAAPCRRRRPLRQLVGSAAALCSAAAGLPPPPREPGPVHLRPPRSQIAQRTGRHVSEVRNIIIWGNHSSTQVRLAQQALWRGRHGWRSGAAACGGVGASSRAACCTPAARLLLHRPADAQRRRAASVLADDAGPDHCCWCRCPTRRTARWAAGP